MLGIEPAESGQDIYTVSTAMPSGVSERESSRTVFELIRKLSEAKKIFWTSNPVGNALLAALRDLVQAGIMESDPDDETVFRWNPFFKSNWSWKSEEQT